MGVWWASVCASQVCLVPLVAEECVGFPEMSYG